MVHQQITRAELDSGLEGYSFLPREELQEVLASKEAQNLLVAVHANHDSEQLEIVRGDLRVFVVPFSDFKPAPNCSPDFSNVEVGDYGHSLVLGDYEASTRSVLYPLDRDFRIRMINNLRPEYIGYGKSLKRLRLQNDLGMSDVVGFSAEEITQLESSNDIPDLATQERLAEAFSVQVQDIETY